jgi:transposase, IS30 family
MPQNQLTMKDRYFITHLHHAGWSNAAIGRQLRRHRATIGRELRRNRDVWGVYHHQSAQGLAEQRRTAACCRYKLDDAQTPLGQQVRAGLTQRWSPQQIVGRLRRMSRGRRAPTVTAETIYRWIYRRHRLGERWYEQLRRRHRRRRRRVVGERRGNRGRIPGRVGIEQRPAAANDRRRFGDWESDTVEGRKGCGLLVTHVERKSRYLRLGKLANKQAATLSVVSSAVLGDLPAGLRRTLTADNGKEFADFAALERTLALKVYFANPHAPWERGANENTNGLLRDWFPKGSDLSQVSPRQLAQVQSMLNNRPRKCLNYRTPLEVLNALPGVALRN